MPDHSEYKEHLDNGWGRFGALVLSKLEENDKRHDTLDAEIRNTNTMLGQINVTLAKLSTQLAANYEFTTRLSTKVDHLSDSVDSLSADVTNVRTKQNSMTGAVSYKVFYLVVVVLLSLLGLKIHNVITTDDRGISPVPRTEPYPQSYNEVPDQPPHVDFSD